GLQPLELRAFKSETREPILGHLVASSRLPHLTPEVGHLRHRQAGLLGNHHQLGRLERLVQRRDPLLVLGSVHWSLRYLSPAEPPAAERPSSLLHGPPGQTRTTRL